jgi:hypothetical protein
VLDHPAAGAELSLATDASATHVGAVIQQKCPGSVWQPLGFFSAQLDKAQTNYSTFNRELMAVVAAIKHFRYMLEGMSFVVFTDHKPLVGALGRPTAATFFYHRVFPQHQAHRQPIKRGGQHSLTQLRFSRHHPHSSSFRGSLPPQVAVLARQAIG